MKRLRYENGELDTPEADGRMSNLGELINSMSEFTGRYEGEGIGLSQFLEDGGTPGELKELACEAGGERVGLFWTWMKDVYSWRSVLADRRQRRKEARIRRAQSESQGAPPRAAGGEQ